MKSIIVSNIIKALTVSLGIIYLWFGILKFFPGLSPAEILAKDTIEILVFGIIPRNVTIILLATMEVMVGICLISQYFKKFAIKLAIVHMIFTFSPMVLLPEIAFGHAPGSCTLVGQYILKNLVILCVLLLLLFIEQGKIKVVVSE